jgi:hypothetical protein
MAEREDKMHHIVVNVDERGVRFGREDYRVSIFCKLVGEKILAGFDSLSDAELFAKAKANELGIEYVKYEKIPTP